MASTPARNLLPPWLVHHDCVASAVNDSNATASSSNWRPLGAAAAAGVPSATPAPHLLTPPSHIALVPWDDGFTPSGCGGKPGKIVRDQVRSSPGALRVFDGAVSRNTADRLYASAVRAKVWGVYVPTSELDLTAIDGTTSRCAAFSDVSNKDDADDTTETEADRQALARRAVQELLVDQASSSQSPCVYDNDTSTSSSSTATRAIISAQDWANTHGVAVWVIASDCDDETEYHLDYAEMVRFETNVIIPPLYGATLHVSPLRNRDVRVRTSGDGVSTAAPAAAPVSSSFDTEPLTGTVAETPLPELDGGAFFVHSDGLAHYAQLGYKTRRLAHKRSTDALEAASSTERGWTHVPYAYRRGIVCDGEFPHFSSRVRSLPDAAALAAATGLSAPRTQPSLPVKRVVVGFNLFPHEIGAFVHKFPEHSAAFNRHVKLAQAAAKQIAAASAAGLSATNNPNSITDTSCACESDAKQGSTKEAPPQTWSLASVRANPKQAALLTFLAKKMKEKGVDIASLRSASPTTTCASPTTATAS